MRDAAAQKPLAGDRQPRGTAPRGSYARERR
jgi:hypothetical protein